jgi:hypothetical protein
MENYDRSLDELHHNPPAFAFFWRLKLVYLPRLSTYSFIITV